MPPIFQSFTDPSRPAVASVCGQVRDAERFLATHRRAIGRLRRFPGVQVLVLDFPVDLRVGRDIVAQFDRFPASLVREAGKLSLALELSVYRTGRQRRRTRSPRKKERPG